MTTDTLFGAKVPSPLRGLVFMCRKTKAEMVVTRICRGLIYYRPTEGRSSFCVQATNWKHVAATRPNVKISNAGTKTL